MNKIVGVIFQEGEDYSLWTGFGLTKAEKEVIDIIIADHVNEGCSIRGDMKKIIKELRSIDNDISDKK